MNSVNRYISNVKFSNHQFIVGGSTRQESLKRGLSVVDTPFVLVSDIARCCLDREMVERVIELREVGASVVPTLKPTDTLYLNSTPLNRDEVRIIQTPQYLANTLKRALDSTDREFTDDSSDYLQLEEG